MVDESDPPSGDKSQYDQETEGSETLILEKIQNPSKLEKISSGTIFDAFGGCPNLFRNCAGEDTTCAGDINKFRACEVFFEKNLTAPPKGIDCHNSVLEQLKGKKEHYENLNQACVAKRIDLEQAKQNYKQALEDLSTFKGEYFI